MGAMSHVLLDRGHRVSGCDATGSAPYDLLRRGVRCAAGHSADHVLGTDFVFVSSAAIRGPVATEIRAARDSGIRVLSRSDLFGEWSSERPTLAIAGTHGKTTTTAMAVTVMRSAGMRPSYVVPAGGPVSGLPVNGAWGGNPFVAEADEYARTFLGFFPHAAIITSVDWDHRETYPTPDSEWDAYVEFARKSRCVFACSDNPGSAGVAERLRGQVGISTYGRSEGSDWLVSDVAAAGLGSSFSVSHGGDRAKVRLEVPGVHNVLNAAAAIASAVEFGVGFRESAEAVRAYRGAYRRFEVRMRKGGIVLVDDYAHNPGKVRATVAAARAAFPGNRLVCFFGPQHYRRTTEQAEGFAGALSGCDLVFVGGSCSTREDRPDHDPAAALAEKMGVSYLPDVPSAAKAVRAAIREGDVVITVGAQEMCRAVSDCLQESLG